TAATPAAATVPGSNADSRRGAEHPLVGPLDAGHLVDGGHPPEVADRGVPVGQQGGGQHRAGVLPVAFDQEVQLGRLGVVGPARLDQLRVEPPAEEPVGVVDVGLAAGHAGAEVVAHGAEYDNGPPRHVFTAVVAG